MQKGFTKRNIASLTMVTAIVEKSVVKAMPEDELAKVEDPDQIGRTVSASVISTLQRKEQQDG